MIQILKNKKTYVIFAIMTTLAILYCIIMEYLSWTDGWIIFWFSSFPILFLINWYFVFRKEEKRTLISFRISLPCIITCFIIPLANLSFAYSHELETSAMCVSFFIMYIEIVEKYIYKNN